MSEATGILPHGVGLLLAAGRSQRMGTLKQTLPWPRDDASSEAERQSTIIASAYDAIAPACQRMFVVVGRDADAVLDALEPRAFCRVNADSNQEMFASVVVGLSAILHSADSSAAVDVIVLQPGDHPGIGPAIMDELIAAFVVDRGRAVIPEYRRKGGHPVLIPRPIAEAIVQWSGETTAGGLRRFWAKHPHLCRRIATDDAVCTMDIDTPEDYTSALTARNRRSGRF